jgi:hypothetical protein
LKYLGRTASDQNLIQEEIKMSSNSDNAWVQNILLSCLLYKHINIITCRTVILPVVLHWCETWSLTLREKHRVCVFEYSAQENIYTQTDGKWQESGEKCIKRRFIISTLCQ